MIACVETSSWFNDIEQIARNLASMNFNISKSHSVLILWIVEAFLIEYQVDKWIYNIYEKKPTE